MTNIEARKHIAELYNRVREFERDKLSPILNPDLHVACHAIPELNDFAGDLKMLLLEFNDKLIKFADEKYPIDK